MTVVVAVAHEGQVWMGADAAVSAPGVVDRIAGPKIVRFRRGRVPLLIGAAGMPRLIQVLEHGLKVPAHPRAMSDEAWIVTRLTAAIQTACAAAGYEFDDQSVLLVGYRGRVWEIDDSLAAIETASREGVIGSGTAYALGSLATTRALPMSPEQRVRLALSAACEFSPTCAEPLTVVASG